MARFGEVLTAMVTPFDANGAVDLDAAQALAKWLVAQGNDGLVRVEWRHHRREHFTESGHRHVLLGTGPPILARACTGVRRCFVIGQCPASVARAMARVANRSSCISIQTVW